MLHFENINKYEHGQLKADPLVGLRHGFGTHISSKWGIYARWEGIEIGGGYHLEIPAPGGALDEVGSRVDIVDDGPLEPGDDDVSPLRVDLHGARTHTQISNAREGTRQITQKENRPIYHGHFVFWHNIPFDLSLCDSFGAASYVS